MRFVLVKGLIAVYAGLVLVPDSLKAENPHIVFILAGGKGKGGILGDAGRDKAELYMISKDPGETQNLIDAYPDIARELEAKLKAVIQANPK